MKKINSKEELNSLISSGSPVIIDFYADWCGPCKALAPKLERAAVPEGMQIVKVDVDSLPEIAAEYGVRGIPMLIKIEDKKVKNTSTGNIPEDALKEFIES